MNPNRAMLLSFRNFYLSGKFKSLDKRGFCHDSFLRSNHISRSARKRKESTIGVFTYNETKFGFLAIFDDSTNFCVFYIFLTKFTK